MNKKTGSYYHVFEKNKILALFVKNHAGELLYGRSGYQNNPGQLTRDLDALDQGCDLDALKTGDPNPQFMLEFFLQYPPAEEVCFRTNGGKRMVVAESLGPSGRAEFLSSPAGSKGMNDYEATMLLGFIEDNRMKFERYCRDYTVDIKNILEALKVR